MSVQDLYLKKRGTAEDAIDQVKNGDFIIVPTGVGEPPTLLTALSAQRRRFHDVKVGQILAVRKFGYIDPETVAHVRHVAFFFGAATRVGGQSGWIDFIPSYFSEMPSLIESGVVTNRKKPICRASRWRPLRWVPKNCTSSWSATRRWKYTRLTSPTTPTSRPKMTS